MNTMGVLLLAAATSTGGLFGKPHVGGKKLLRAHAVQDGPAPPGGMIQPPVGPGGAGGPGGPGGPGGAGAAGRRFPNVRSQVFFVEPTGMKIGWQTAGGGNERVYLPAQLTVPARYNFTQGYIYRLKITDIAGRGGLTLYPTIEVAPSTPATDAYLTHNPIPAIFTEEDFDQVVAGNFVTKVIYLPDPKYQELAVSGVETLVSTRLEPGVDPILEADRRGTILMIMRLGAIDLEMPTSGASSVTVPTSPTSVPLSPTPTTIPGTVTPPPAGTTPPPAGTTPPPFVPQSGTVVPVDPNAPTTTPPPATPPAPAPMPQPAPPPVEPPAPGDKPAEPAAPADKPATDPAAPADKPADPGVTPTGGPAPADAPPEIIPPRA